MSAAFGDHAFDFGSLRSLCCRPFENPTFRFFPGQRLNRLPAQSGFIGNDFDAENAVQTLRNRPLFRLPPLTKPIAIGGNRNDCIQADLTD